MSDHDRSYMGGIVNNRIAAIVVATVREWDHKAIGEFDRLYDTRNNQGADNDIATALDGSSKWRSKLWRKLGCGL